MSKRKEETTQELLGIKELREYGVRTYRKEELAYFLIRPSNLSVLSEESLSATDRACSHNRSWRDTTTM